MVSCPSSSSKMLRSWNVLSEREKRKQFNMWKHFKIFLIFIYTKRVYFLGGLSPKISFSNVLAGKIWKKIINGMMKGSGWVGRLLSTKEYLKHLLLSCDVTYASKKTVLEVEKKRCYTDSSSLWSWSFNYLRVYIGLLHLSLQENTFVQCLFFLVRTFLVIFFKLFFFGVFEQRLCSEILYIISDITAMLCTILNDLIFFK